jgi:hypothetical protein
MWDRRYDFMNFCAAAPVLSKCAFYFHYVSPISQVHSAKADIPYMGQNSRILLLGSITYLVISEKTPLTFKI